MTATRSEENLKTAFVAEAKASLRLLGYAEKAEQEGYEQMARLFRAISAAEKVHAIRHLRLLGIVRSTEENLKASFEAEVSVSEDIYPEFVRVAEQEGNSAASTSFSHARDAEGYHAKLYKNALDHMIEERETTYHVCQVCGYVADGQPPDNCPVCNAPRDRFEQVD